MKFLIVLMAVVVASQHQILALTISEEWTQYKVGISKEWKQYKIKFGKQYKNVEEDQYRMSIYIANKQTLTELKKYATTYTIGITKFTDLLYGEFAATSFGVKRSLDISQTSGKPFTSSGQLRLPSSVDWRTSGAVTPVKDQLQCGCCWSFSATGGLEGQYFRKTGALLSLSEQNLVDCSTKYGNAGCGGGLMEYAFQYVTANGIEKGITYPYEAKDGTCRFNPSNSAGRSSGFVNIMMGSESQLQEAVATVGPISVAVDASGWQFYTGGVYTNSSCNAYDLNHGVLVVGYGTDASGVAYWIVKNSWGSSWGINGYIHLARNQNNMCGVATLASYPLV